MKTLIRIIIIFLAVVSCTQLLGRYLSFYNLLDELLLAGLLFLFIFQKKFSLKKNNLIVVFAILFYFVLNFTINFYSPSAFLLKSLYYIKSILPFLILPYFCNKFLKQKQLKIIYYLLFSFALFSIIEFYILQYVSIWSFGQDWPFKLRNGLYRAMALTGHPISLGILNFMGILIGNEIFKTKKRYLLVFVVSLILTGSRIPLVFLAFYIFYCTRNFKIKLLFNKYFYFKTLYALSIPLSFVAIFFIPTYFNNVNEGSTTRLIAIENGVKVFKNPKNILFGTGIGSFGTSESVVYNSQVYDEIDFPIAYKDVILTNKATGVETFLFMSLIEMGLIGFVLYYVLILNLFNKKISEFKAFLIIVFILYTLVYPLYTFPFVFLINIYFPKLLKPKTNV